MPYSILTRPGEPVALFRMSGSFGAEEGARAFSDYVTRVGFDPKAAMLSDARAITDIPANYRQVATRIVRLGPALACIAPGTRAVLLVATDTQFGMARMLSQAVGAAAPIQFHVTRSEAEALALAGCPDRSIADLARRLSRPGTRTA